MPKVNAIIELSNITTKEYGGIVDANKVDLKNIKKIHAYIEIRNSKNCSKREIMIPDLNVIDNYDGVRSYKSESSTINNLNKGDHAMSSKYIIFNSSELSLNDIKNIYSNENIHVNIVTSDNEEVVYNYNVGELLK